MKIEQFLNNQGQILLKNRLEQNSDLNYYKINPYVLEKLKPAIEELKMLIINHKEMAIKLENLNKSESKFKSAVSDTKNSVFMVESLIFSSLSVEEISSQILGRFLRIISNNNLFNKKLYNNLKFKSII